MISFKQQGDFSKTIRYLENAKKVSNFSFLDKYGEEGVAALSAATPKESGKTANSWYYKIENDKGRIRIDFCNSNIQNGVPIAILLQYGHTTGTGGWVEGKDYINPAVQPIFDKIANEAWKEVAKL